MSGGVFVTVSVGMAEGLVRSEDEWRELYRRADAALYQAKAQGRNRAVHAPREPDPEAGAARSPATPRAVA
jgi:PleD family two-component response regulator